MTEDCELDEEPYRFDVELDRFEDITALSFPAPGTTIPNLIALGTSKGRLFTCIDGQKGSCSEQFDINTGDDDQTQQKVKAHQSEIVDLKFITEKGFNYLVSAEDGFTIHLWELKEASQTLGHVFSLPGPAARVNSIDYHIRKRMPFPTKSK